MIFVWGKSTETKEVGKGQFYCPECDGVREYTMSAQVSGDHIYGIQITENVTSGKYVECDSCKTAYKQDVLYLNDQGEVDEQSKFLPLGKHDALKKLFNRCCNYQKEIEESTGTCLGCLLMAVLPLGASFIATGLLSQVFPSMGDGALGAVMIATAIVLFFVIGAKVYDRDAAREQELYTTKIKERLEADIAENGVKSEDFASMLKNETELEKLSELYRKG